MPDTNPTACLLVIGNEVLSGRTQDANIRFLATGLGEIGIPLREVRVIPDVPQTIIDTVNEVRAKFDYVFTTGGIGPTHDDITSECIAAAFGVPWEPHPDAWARMERSYKPGEFNAARQRMATMPRGATLIDNAISVAPGFQIGNVYVMAGVPRIMQSMFEWLAPQLQGGSADRSRAPCMRSVWPRASSPSGSAPCRSAIPASISAATRSTARAATAWRLSPREPTPPRPKRRSRRLPRSSRVSARRRSQANRRRELLDTAGQIGSRSAGIHSGGVETFMAQQLRQLDQPVR